MEPVREIMSEDLRIQARMIVEKFEKMSKAHDVVEKPNLYTAKIKRYQQYVQDKLVRVEQPAELVEGVHVPAHALHSQWVLKEQALQMAVNYHCPVEFLQNRGVNV